MEINGILEKKIKNKKWSYEEIDYVVHNFTFDKISEEDMSKFIKLIYEKGLSFKETLFLTNSMIKTGEIINFEDISKIVVDKHSTGGVGDKITLIVSPIVVANGLAVAKMSGRSLGLTGGTIDKLESIDGYNVNLNKEEFIKQVKNIGIAIISQTEKIAIADKKIYSLRDKIGAVDSIPLIASSIMSKKIASGSKVIVIDLKIGKGAFIKNLYSAKKLAKTMIKIGKYWKVKVVVILSDMNTPLGMCIGNALEVKEAINFFNGIRDERLEQLSLIIASYMISLGKGISVSKSYKLAKKSLEDKEALKTFNLWIKTQGGNILSLKDKSKVLDVYSDKCGYVNGIDANKIATICNELGSGRGSLRKEVDYSVGVELIKRLGDEVKKNDIIAKVYYNKKVENIEQKILDTYLIERILRKKKDIIIGVIK